MAKIDAEVLEEAGLKLDEQGHPCCLSCGSTEFIQLCDATLRSYWHVDEAGTLVYDDDKVVGEDTQYWYCQHCEAVCSPDVVLEALSDNRTSDEVR